MTSTLDLQRLVALKAKGAARLMLNAQAELEDVEGALEAGQIEVAAIQARAFVVTCLSVLSLARGGEIDSAPDDPAFDPYRGLDAGDISAALALAARALHVSDREASPAYLRALRGVLARAEAALGLDEPLPWLRSPEGLFPALRLARDWLPLVEELGLPQVLPPQWTGLERS